MIVHKLHTTHTLHAGYTGIAFTSLTNNIILWVPSQSQGWFTPSAVHDPQFAAYNGTIATDRTSVTFVPF